MKNVDALRAMPRWLAAFLLGAIVPWLVWLLGHVWPAGYDRVVLPVLHRFVLPFLWIALASSAGLALIRPDEAGSRRDAAMLLLGLAVGTLLTNDAWYFTPFAAAIAVPLVAWHFRWHLWSQSQLLVLTVVTLVLVVLAGAALDFHNLIPDLDNRFSLGLSGRPNAIIASTLIAGLVSLLVWWGISHSQRADAQNRALLADIIDRDPRCARYFDTVARLTPCGLDRKVAAPRRFPRVAHGENDRAPSLDPLFPDSSGWHPPVFDVWNLGYAFADRDWLLPAIRFLRSAGRPGEFPSRALQELLREALRREHQTSLAALAGVNASTEPVDLFARFLPASAEDREKISAVADRHFSRYALLREALLEAKSYFFLAAPRLTREDAIASCPGLLQQFKTELPGLRRPVAAEDGSPERFIEPWRKIAAEYQCLWIEQIDRLFIRHGDRCADGLAKAGVDFAQLTCNLLAARRASRTQEHNLHALATDLALLLLLLPANEGLAMRDALATYFKTLRDRMNVARDFKLFPEDWRELALSASAYGLALGFNRNWVEARMAFTMFGHEFKERKDADAQRIDAHLHAADTLQQFHRGGGFGMTDNVHEVVLAYLGLKEFPPNPVLFDGRCPPEFLACAFAGHVSELESVRAQREETIMLKEHLQRLLKNCTWSRETVKNTDLCGCSEMPRFPIRARTVLFVGALGTLSLLSFFLFGNAAARVRDPRLSTQYNSRPLTGLAADRDHDEVWIGSDGAGIRVYDPQHHLFARDISRASTGDKLLSDFILDLDFGPKEQPLAAIVVHDGKDSAGGVQISTSTNPPIFWDKPVIDLSSFPGLNDTNASCVVASSDNERLIIGTRGRGIGVYHIRAHSWGQRLTSREGLPSDFVTDLATVSEARTDGVIWIATDKGICAGPLDARGHFEKRWSYNVSSALAGEFVRRLTVRAGHVWYLTDGRGAGRIPIDARGAPVSDGAHQLLISERRLPGITDASLRRAKGSPAGPTTWFLAEIAKTNFLGLYREKPHDTTGVALPQNFSASDVTFLSTDPESGARLLIGSSSGAWFYRDEAQEGGSALSQISGGFAGPVNTRVQEGVLRGTMAVIKNKSARGRLVLQRSAATASLPWNWSTLVGDGRFEELKSREDLTAVAGNSNRVVFGTRGKGIGLWDRSRMEVRLAMHSSRSEAESKLRHDTSLDLALNGDTLVQVTGDKAVDTFTGSTRTALVPQDEAPMSPAEIITATAKGSIFACAGADKVGVYDIETFGWSSLPGITGIARLEVSRGILWALNQSGELFATPLRAVKEQKDWKSVAQNVKDIAATLDMVYVLVKEPDRPMQVRAFSGDDASGRFALAPQALSSQQTQWRFASMVGGDLLLAGDDRALHRYSLKTREWERLEFPGDITPPIVSAARTLGGLWLLDSAKVLHLFVADGNKFETGLEKQVERVGAAESSVVALLSPPGQRLVWRADNGRDRRVVVGRPFTGNMSQVSDALEWKGKLVLAQGSQLGLYDWSTHDWESVATSASSITRFYTSGETLWALCGSGASTTLQHWTGSDFAVVQGPGGELRISKLSVGESGLFILDAQGRVLVANTAQPTSAQELIAATRIAGGNIALGAPMALLQENLVLHRNQQFQRFGPALGLAKWVSFPWPHSIKRLINDPRQERLVANTESQAWVITLDGEQISSQELKPSSFNTRGAVTISGTAAGAREAVAGAQVAGETGARVWSLPAGANETRELIGAPLTGAKQTKVVLSDPTSRELVRLDGSGIVSAYSPDARQWREETSSGGLDVIWNVGNEIAGFNQTRKTIFMRGRNQWTQDRLTAGKVQKASASDGGIIAALTSGEWAWVQPNGHANIVRPAVNPRNAPGALGEIVGAAEDDGVLAVLGQSGRLALFDWRKQSWIKFDGPRVLALARSGKMYLLVETPAGPQVATLARNFSGDAVPSLITAPVRVKTFAVAPTGVFCLGEDRAIYQLSNGTWRRRWGGAPLSLRSAIVQPVLVAAEQSASELHLLVEQRGQAFFLNVNLATLESRAQPLPAAIENVFTLTNGDTYVTVTATNGLFPMHLRSQSALALPSTNFIRIAGVGDAVWGLTTNEIYRLEPTGWRLAGTNEATTNLIARLKMPAPLALPAGTFIVSNKAGAWRWQSGAAVDVLAGGDRRQRKVLLSETAGSLAHEMVNDLAARGDTLFAATDGGLVALSTGADGAPRAVLYGQPDGVPAAKMQRAQVLTTPVCQAASGEWFAMGNGAWRAVSAPNAMQIQQARNAAAKENLENWEPAATGDTATWRRRFNGQWRTVKLQSDGFDFEQICAADAVAGQALFHTPAGTLVSGGNSLEPDDLLPRWALPVTSDGRTVVRGPAGEIFLRAEGAGAGALLVRGQDTWRPATPADQQNYASITSGPFLSTDTFVWERGNGLDGPERVKWKLAGGNEIVSAFATSAGRFGWDICTAVGQAGGQAWMLTGAGLFRVEGDRIDAASYFPFEADTALAFANVSGDLAGALVRDGQPVLVFDGQWKRASEAGNDTTSSLGQFIATGKTWKLKSDGTILRSLPQKPDSFVPAQLMPDGRWNFETIHDLAAAKGSCHLATEAGLASAQNDTPGLRSWWPETGTASEVDVPLETPVARLKDGRTVEFDGRGWVASTFGGRLHAATQTNQGARFKSIRAPAGVSFEVKSDAGGVFEPVRILGSGFAFDQIQDAHVREDATVEWTDAGLLETYPGGDFITVKPAGLNTGDKLDFFRATRDAGVSLLHAHSSGGQFWRFQNGWQSMPMAAGNEALQLSKTRLAMNSVWQVTRSNGPVEIRLHLETDPAGVYKLVKFDSPRGLFRFDDFTSIGSPDSEGRLLIGSAHGLQRVTADGRMQRLWCQKDGDGRTLDGISPLAVQRLVRDEQGVLQALIEGQYHALEVKSDVMVPSTRDRFDRALAVRAAEPRGWRVDMNPAAKIPLQIQWRDEPAFLVKGESGHARFAHNVVHSALFADGTLLLGTEGGLVTLNSEREADRANLTILAKPFLAGTPPLPVPLTWLGLSEDGRTVTARSAQGARAWRIPAADPARVSADGIFAKTDESGLVHGDDVLVWKHPAAGKVEVGFAPGKAFPESTEPRIERGTFTFLALDVDEAGGEPATLVETSAGTLWATRAGLVQFNGAEDKFTRLYGEATGRETLAGASELFWNITNRLLYARAARNAFAFDPLNESWQRVTGADPFLARPLVNDSPMLEWRQSQNAVRVTMKNSDCERLEFFAQGRPTFDEVNDFAFAPEEGRGVVSLATHRGVVSYDEEQFGYLGVAAAAFAQDCQDIHKLAEVAAVEVDGVWKKGARADDGTTYEAVGGEWKAARDVQSIFELSYRRVAQPNLWNWARYANGLSCTLLNVNGEPFRLGHGVDPTFARIFSRGKLALDDARGATLTARELLVETPVGLARYRLNAALREAVYEGIDVWAEDTRSNRVAMTGLQGVLRDQVVTMWNERHVFLNADPRERNWTSSVMDPAKLAATRWMTDGSESWQIEMRKADSEIAVSYRGGIAGSLWCVPVTSPEIRDSAASDQGLWIATPNELFHVSTSRMKRNLRNFFGAKFSGPDTPADPAAKN